MELRDYVRAIWRSWILVVACVVAGVGGAGISLAFQPPVYKTSTTWLASSPDGETIGEINAANSLVQQRLQTYVDLVASDRVITSAAATLELPEWDGSVIARIPSGTRLLETEVTGSDPDRTAAFANALLDALQEEVESIEPGSYQTLLSMVQPATAPSAPSSPNVRLVLLLGLLFGIAAGLGLAVLREVLETRIRNAVDIVGVTDVPVIAQVPRPTAAVERVAVADPDTDVQVIEAYRELRANVLARGTNATMQQLVITAAGAGEHTSVVAANLAVALANSGRRVLLIDADFMAPSLSRLFGISDSIGLAQVTDGTAHLHEALQRWGVHSMQLLPAGTTPPDPGDLLASLPRREFDALASGEFDVVIWIAPPMTESADASLLAHDADAVLLVISAREVRRRQLVDALESLGRAKAEVSGIVLVNAPTTGPDAFAH